MIIQTPRLRLRGWEQADREVFAARAALNDAFERVGLTEVVSYTAADNLRSQSVMVRLHMQRDPSRDLVWTRRE